MGGIPKMTVMISTRTCKIRITTLWFIVGIALFLILVLQSILGKFGDNPEEAWVWFLPTIMPTLSLIIGVLVLDATTASGTDKQIERFIFQLTFSLSVFYLAMVGITLFIQPFTSISPLKLMKLSNLWLGPLQGMVAAALGVFFVKGERGEKNENKSN
jgi:hypothetical protein